MDNNRRSLSTVEEGRKIKSKGEVSGGARIEEERRGE